MKIVNERSVRAFAEAHKRISQLSDDYPWIDDLREIDELMQEAGSGLGAVADAGQDDDRGCR